MNNLHKICGARFIVQLHNILNQKPTAIKEIILSKV